MDNEIGPNGVRYMEVPLYYNSNDWIRLIFLQTMETIMKGYVFNGGSINKLITRATGQYNKWASGLANQGMKEYQVILLNLCKI